MKKLLLILTLITAVLLTGTFAFAAEDKFSDISKHWAKDSVNKVALKDMFSVNDGKFLPEKAITRSEFVLLVHKALDIRIMYFKAPDIGEFFTDVKNEDVYASALYDLVIANIIDYKGQFRPDSTMTREEMVHFLMNAYKYKMGDSFKQIKLPFKPFADDAKIDPLYNGDVTRAEYEGLLKRPANNKFYPRDLATRAQAVTVVDRLLKLMEKEKGQMQDQVTVTPAAEIKDGALNMKLTITNRSEKQIVINHTSGQKYDFKVFDASGNSLYTWSADKMFMMMLTETVIDPGKSEEFAETVEKGLLDGLSSKPAYIKAFITGTSEDFKINDEGYEAEVK